MHNTIVWYVNRQPWGKVWTEWICGKLNPEEKPYGEKPYRRKALHFLKPVEKSPTAFWQIVEKPYTNFSDREEKPPNPKNSVA